MSTEAFVQVTVGVVVGWLAVTLLRKRAEPACDCVVCTARRRGATMVVDKVPVEDSIEHEPGPDCPCGPTVERLALMVEHHALTEPSEVVDD